MQCAVPPAGTKSRFTRGYYDLFRVYCLVVDVKLTLKLQVRRHKKYSRRKEENPVAISVQLIQHIRFHNVFVKFHTPPQEKPCFHSQGFIGNESTERSLDILFFSPTTRRLLFWS